MARKKSTLNDVANERPAAEIPIDRVGVKGVRLPVRVLDREREYQDTIATVDMSVDLPAHFRGTHMSRFVEVLYGYRDNVNYRTMAYILREMVSRFDAARAHLVIGFPYFIYKAAPASAEKSFLEVRARFIGDFVDRYSFSLGVTVPVANLCPCSKDISDAGAHNQRGDVYVELESRNIVWIEEVVAWAEEAASAPLFALLKREDEKAVTELAYGRPRFVEDVVRNVAEKLERDKRVRSYRVECTNYESIHQHDAYAAIARDKRERSKA
ncbi:MAG: GTP cyclohydrolase FolE2 [bacterium]